MHYRKHIFCCVNERVPEHPRSCCSARGSIELRNYMKSRAKELGIDDIRVNNSGCLERCELGPAMVIYPEGIWYHYDSTDDIDEILQNHILNDRPVKRLMLKDGQIFPEHGGFDRLRLVVSTIDKVSADILQVEFENADSGKLPKFAAGAHLDLLIDNDRIRRSYALINDPRERHRYVIGVLKGKNRNGGAHWIHSKLRSGDVIKARYPENIFRLNESATRHVLIAEGIGITSILSMSSRLQQIESEFRVYYFTNPLKGAEFIDQLEKVCGNRLTVQSKENGIEIDEILNKELGNYVDGSHYYLCGSSRFMSDITNAATNWPSDVIHKLYFHSDSMQTSQSNAFNVSLARRQKTIRVGNQQSILDALREADIPIDYACEDGLCGACRVNVLYGQVEHFDSVLSEREKSNQRTMMVCKSRAAIGESRLILDI